MAYKALYRTYRPQTFAEVVGQRAIVDTLRNSILRDRIAHAYLFCGPRGTGKTSIAKIFAKAVNCENFVNEPCNECDNCKEITAGTHPDVIEMDAASNNSVDNIREIIEKVKYAPIRGKYKVYIIDEVHMLSQGAFNALLKTLEEPPAHVIFILATTEPLKIPATIISRCQRYDFGRIAEQDILSRLQEVCKQEGIEANEQSLKLIARLSSGGMRDALSILDQCVSYCSGTIKAEDVSSIYGLVSTDELIGYLRDIKENKATELFDSLNACWSRGIDVTRLTGDLLNVSKEAAVYQVIHDPKGLSRLNQTEADQICTLYSTDELVKMVDLFLDTQAKFRVSENRNSYFEVCMLKAMEMVSVSKQEVRTITTNFSDHDAVKNTENAVSSHPDQPVRKPNSAMEKAKEKLAKLGYDIPEVTNYEQEENVSRETKSLPEDINLDTDTLIDVLQTADKQHRQADEEKWQNIKSYDDDPQYRPYAKMLSRSSILASGDDAIIVIVQTKMVANAINSANDNNAPMVQFINHILGEDKYIMALTSAEGQSLVDEFRNRKKSGIIKSADQDRLKVAKVKKENTQAVAEETERDSIPDKISASNKAPETVPITTEQENTNAQYETDIEKLDKLLGKGNYDIKDE